LPKKEIKHKEEEKELMKVKFLFPQLTNPEIGAINRLKFPNKNLEKPAEPTYPYYPRCKIS